MSKYELMIIVNAALTQEEREKIFTEATDTVVKSGGKLINSQVWLEKNKLAFIMKKATHGTYYLITFESPSSSISKIRQVLKMNEGILRFLIVNVKG
ncbi:MAG: 30S ribosomal protein S6 [Candidatus Omnitrophota bacterium]